MVDLSEFIDKKEHEGGVHILNATAEQIDRPLFNKPEAQYTRQKEQEWHRMAALLAAQGYTQVEIAQTLGRSPAAVSDVLRQDYAKPVVLAEMRRIATEDEQVITIVKENVAKAVETLADICNDRGAPKRDRIAAANALLDRRYGKPNQPIARDTGIDLDKLTDDELAKMLPATVSTGTNP